MYNADSDGALANGDPSAYDSGEFLDTDSHTLADVVDSAWPPPYPRETAAYPVATLRADKYWPPVNRVDNVYGDRHLFCSCPAIDTWREPVTD